MSRWTVQRQGAFPEAYPYHRLYLPHRFRAQLERFYLKGVYIRNSFSDVGLTNNYDINMLLG